jgi:hypothetical protein
MTDAKDVPICTCFDEWHANNAGNHALTCPVIAAFTTLIRERDEARVVTDAMVERAAKAWYEHETPYFWRLASQDTKRSFLSTARAALTAALTQEDA